MHVCMYVCMSRLRHSLSFLFVYLLFFFFSTAKWVDGRKEGWKDKDGDKDDLDLKKLLLSDETKKRREMYCMAFFKLNYDTK